MQTESSPDFVSNLNPATRNSNNFTLAYQKATDWKGNKRIIIPDIDDEDVAIEQTYMKKELLKVVENYKNEFCDKTGKIKVGNNLLRENENAIKTLKKKCENENLAIYETDKTGKFVVDTLENYENKMRKHFKEDKIIIRKEVKKIQKQLNRHTEH